MTRAGEIFPGYFDPITGDPEHDAWLRKVEAEENAGEPCITRLLESWSQKSYRPNLRLSDQSELFLKFMQYGIGSRWSAFIPERDLHLSAFYFKPTYLYQVLRESGFDGDKYEFLVNFPSFSLARPSLKEVDALAFPTAYDYFGEGNLLALRLELSEELANFIEFERWWINKFIPKEFMSILESDPKLMWLFKDFSPHITLGSFRGEVFSIEDLPAIGDTVLQFDSIRPGSDIGFNRQLFIGV
jgi:hypothetical protein